LDNHFYVDDASLANIEWLELSGQEAKHVFKVLRKKKGDTITIVNGKGCKVLARIEYIQKNKISLTIESKETKKEPAIKKVLAFGFIKKRERFEFAIEKAVEMGATSICIFDADHSERTRINPDRLDALIKTAFKQSGRWWLPDLVYKPDLKSVLFEYADHEMIMAHEKEEINKPQFNTKKEKLILVGPEGGFSEKEVNVFKQAGGTLISLGNHRLRTETAVITALSLFLYD
jgi:16S rRNA (uracil1498-N3)-methyltransferase